jgi:hypothetical protein
VLFISVASLETMLAFFKLSVIGKLAELSLMLSEELDSNITGLDGTKTSTEGTTGEVADDVTDKGDEMSDDLFTKVLTGACASMSTSESGVFTLLITSPLALIASAATSLLSVELLTSVS